MSYGDPAEYITWQVLAHLIISFNVKMRNKSNKYYLVLLSTFKKMKKTWGG